MLTAAFMEEWVYGTHTPLGYAFVVVYMLLTLLGTLCLRAVLTVSITYCSMHTCSSSALVPDAH